MDVMQTIDELSEVLVQEREAIRKLDGATVVLLAERKNACAEALRAMPVADLTPYGHALAVLRADLRRNGVLLAHARACLREAATLAESMGRPSLVQARV